MQTSVGRTSFPGTHLADHSPAAPPRVHVRLRSARRQSMTNVAISISTTPWSLRSHPTATVWVLAAHGWVGPLRKGTEKCAREIKAAGVAAEASRKLADTHLSDDHHAKRARTRE